VELKSPLIDSTVVNESQAARARPHLYRSFTLRIGLGVAIVAFLLWRYDVRPVARVVAQERLGYFVAAIAVYVGGQVMSAWRWQLLARVLGVGGSLREFVAFYFVGMFLNLFVPGLIGGDAARAYYLARRCHRRGEAIASVVADRGIGLITLFWFAGGMAVLMNRTLASPVIRTTVIVGGLSLVGLVVTVFSVRFLPKLPHRVRRAVGIVAPFLRRPQSMVPAIVLSAILQASLAIGQWVLAAGLGLTTPISIFLLCVPIANVVASVPISFNGLGLRETAYLTLFGMAGMERENAIVLGLLWFAVTMIGGLTGALGLVGRAWPCTRNLDETS